MVALAEPDAVLTPALLSADVAGASDDALWHRLFGAVSECGRLCRGTGTGQPPLRVPRGC